MAFWDNWFSQPSGNTDSPGDPDGVDTSSFNEPVETRALPVLRPSAWAGWPSEWAVPNWDFGSKFNELIDVAWMCLDLNSRVISSFPVYRTRNGEAIEPTTWMSNPDPSIYSSWNEFAKQLFWDYQTGEAFVLPMTRFTDGFPRTFRVVPPWLIDVEVRGGGREYRLGGPAGSDVTDDILHIRYTSTTDGARGVGPLEKAGGKMLTAGILAKYVREVVSTGGIQIQTLETEQELSSDEATDLLQRWVDTRAANLGYPPVLDNNVKLVDHPSVSPRDLAMLEITQFNEARIAAMSGVPPFLVALATDSDMTYSNVTSLFDFHDRSALRPYSSDVMSALSGWALPAPQRVELNRDEYSRPAFNERAEAWVKLVEAGIMSVDEVRRAERLTGEAPVVALTGGNANDTVQPIRNIRP